MMRSLLGVALLGAGGPPGPVPAPTRELVVHSAIRPANWDIFLFERRGAPGRPLTTDPGLDYNAVFSPDGRSLLYVDTRDGNADIFVMPFSPEGAGAPVRAVNLTRHEGGDFNPAISPDGRWIVFSSNRDSLRYLNSGSPPDDYQAADIYVMRSDGSGVRRLTREPAWGALPDSHPGRGRRR